MLFRCGVPVIENHINSHAIHELSVIIRRSIAALRVATQDLKDTPSKVLLDRVVDESTTLSGAVAQLSRLCVLSALDSVAPDKEDRPAPDSGVEDMLDLMHRLRNWEQFGPCCKCGLTLPDIE